jgi:CrcB protein
MTIAYVSLFGVLGILLRYGLNHWFGGGLPWVIFLINISGSFLIGFLATSFQKYPSFSPQIATGVLVGFLGGFTTYSTFALDTCLLFDQKRMGAALLYAITTPVFCILLAAIGIKLARVC